MIIKQNRTKGKGIEKKCKYYFFKYKKCKKKKKA